MERHGTVGVDMRDGVEELAHLRDDVEFLVELAPQRLGVTLVRLALTAREFPVMRQVRAGGPQREQEAAATFNDGRDHDDWRH